MTSNMKIILTKKAQLKLKYFVELAEGEISGVGKSRFEGENIIMEDVIIFKQECSSARTILDDEAQAKFMYEMIKADEVVEDWNIWWHSHASMAVFWSATDDATVKAHSGQDYLISLVTIIREPIIVAFGTASSEAAYPKLVQQLERFGCQEKIVGFVLPLGYSFNLDGSMMYMTFAVLFIAQAYGIDMAVDQQIAMLLVLLVTSKGVAGVPRASLVVISATLSAFNIPEAGVLLLLGIDQFLDMGRSATNVLGNSLAAAVVNKWELTSEKKRKMSN